VIDSQLCSLRYVLNILGTFTTGESRLLFSSAQVDYIRYWLHAMQLTKDVIPLPYSDCLLTVSNLRNVSPVVYPDGFSLRNAIKVRASIGLSIARSDVLARKSIKTISGLKALTLSSLPVESCSNAPERSGLKRRVFGAPLILKLGNWTTLF
jgi:hypothetical protein